MGVLKRTGYYFQRFIPMNVAHWTHSTKISAGFLKLPQGDIAIMQSNFRVFAMLEKMYSAFYNTQSLEREWL